jgi:hypothetical protein
MSSSSLRPEPAVVEAPLLQSAYNESAAPLAYVILMKSACRLRFVQRRDAAAMRCGCNAMRRCDGDATAMRRRCDRADGDATAQKPARKPAQKLAQYMQVFLQKYSRIVTIQQVGICRYFIQDTCKYLHIVTSGCPPMCLYLQV